MKYKNSNYYIILKLLKLLRDIILMYFTLPVTFNVFNINEYTFMLKTIICIYAFIYIFIIYFKWSKTNVLISKNDLYIEHGIFIKKKINMNTSNINGINVTTSFIESILNLTTVNIDLGTNNFKIEYVPKYIAEKMNQMINNKNTDLSTYEEKYTLNKYEYIVGSLSLIKLLIFGTFLYSMYEKVNEYIFIDLEKIENIIKSNIYISIIIYILLGLIYSILKSFYKYGGYNVKVNNKCIEVNSGKINSQGYVIKIDNINAITIHYSILKKITKLIKIKTISLKDEKEDEATKLDILFPFIVEEQGYIFIRLYFPQFYIKGEYKKLPISALISKCIRSFIISIIIIFISSYFFKNQLIYTKIFCIIFILLNVLGAIFNGYLIDENKLSFKKIGVFNKIYITNLKNVQEISITQNFIQKMFFISTISIVNKSNPAYKLKFYDIPYRQSKFIIKKFEEINMEEKV